MQGSLFNYRAPYTDRASKAEFVVKRYGAILQKRILDVGADMMYLKNLLPATVDYVGIGLGENPDLLKVDLEKTAIPFSPASFDCVLCLDVLEHLDNVHEVFDQLCSLSKEWVVVSLPNPYADFFNYLCKGKYNPDGEKNLKFYGLPVAPEEDRHKWFYSSREARNFIEQRAARCGYQVADYFAQPAKKSRLKQLAMVPGRVFFPHFDQREFAENTLWWVLKKKQQ